MKIDFSQELKDFRTGEVLVWNAGLGDAKPMTLGMACSEALLAPNQQEQDPEVKSRDLALATQVYEGGEVDVKLQDALRMKSRIAATYPSALVAGQCCALLDG